MYLLTIQRLTTEDATSFVSFQSRSTVYVCLFSIMSNSYCYKRDVNHPILGTPAKHTFKRNEKIVSKLYLIDYTTIIEYKVILQMHVFLITKLEINGELFNFSYYISNYFILKIWYIVKPLL